MVNEEFPEQFKCGVCKQIVAFEDGYFCSICAERLEEVEGE